MKILIFSRNLVIFLFLDTFECRKCQETGEMTKSLEKVMIFSRGLVVFLFLDTFESKKCLKIGEMTKSLQNNDFLRGFGRFSCFQTLLKRKEGRNMRKRPNPFNTESVQKQGNDLIP